MRIAHVLWTFGTGGIQTMLVDIINQQCKEHKVLLLVMNDIIDAHLRDKLDPSVSFYCCKRKEKSRNPFKLLEFNYILRRFSPDIVHCHEDGITKIIIGDYRKIRTIHSVQCESREYKKFQKLICISKDVENHTHQQGFSNTVTIYNGIHIEKIKPSENKDITDITRIVCVGRLHPMKGQDLLVDACNILVNKRGVNNFKITLIGDGSQREVLMSTMSENHLENNIEFLGNKSRDYVYKHLCDYDLFVMTSRTEGFGLTLAEACAAKIAVLSCNLQGPLEVIDDGKLGYSFQNGNVISLADSIESFIKNNNKYQYIESAYNFVSSNFNVINTSKEYLDQYRLIVNSND